MRPSCGHCCWHTYEATGHRYVREELRAGTLLEVLASQHAELSLIHI